MQPDAAPRSMGAMAYAAIGGMYYLVMGTMLVLAIVALVHIKQRGSSSTAPYPTHSEQLPDGVVRCPTCYGSGYVRLLGRDDPPMKK